MTDQTPSPVLQVDIVSDVVCPWCVVGLLQLQQALAARGQSAELRWHPFELNPQMPPEGQNLRDHMIEKYGVTAADSQAARDRLAAVGTELGFTFAFSDDSRMVNTFRAHQLLDWAGEQGSQLPLKLALFRANFSEGRDVSDPEVLVELAAEAGLDPEAARAVLSSGSHAEAVRQKEEYWTDHGIHSVPAMVFQGKYLVSGAQGIEGYAALLDRLAQMPA
ncbi:MAG: DsbA family oxidoreductase [Pseudodonghicola sp.]